MPYLSEKTLWYTFFALFVPPRQGHMPITLLIPELIWPEPEDHETLDDLFCPALSTLLARGQFIRNPAQSMEALLSNLFDHSAPPPYAPLRLYGESGSADEAKDGCWVCADPVHLRFHRDHLILADNGGLGVCLEEAKILVNALNAQLSGIGHFHVASADRWYLKLADPALPELFDAPPLSSVAGRSIERLLPDTSQAKNFRKLLNEIQVLLHTHPLNQERERTDRMPVNSLWLWGTGSLPERTKSLFDEVWSTQPLALGLARTSGVPTHPLPPDAKTLITHTPPGIRHLIVLEDLLRPVQYENGGEYRNALSELESKWFVPLLAALAKGKIKHLRIEATTAYASLSWEIRRSDLWKLWRIPLTISALTKAMAKPSQ